MNLLSKEKGSLSSYENMNDLIGACVRFHHKCRCKRDNSDVHHNRIELSRCILRFHEESGTLTDGVQQSIEKLQDSSCVLLMAAHQPNLFAYSGVLRKGALGQVLENRLSGILDTPVVMLFGIADQDFCDDRWVRSAQLPDVERRAGSLTLGLGIPKTRALLNKVMLPKGTLDGWRKEIEQWLHSKFNSIRDMSRSLGIEIGVDSDLIFGNFEDFWLTVRDAYTKARTYSDFNAFLMSMITNAIWGYHTLFARFSECQQILSKEFCFLLSHFQEYSQRLREAESGVCARDCDKSEHDFIPFWYHCDCGSKARLKAKQEGQSLLGEGQCLGCGRTHRIDFCTMDTPSVSTIMERISARAISMPLVFFPGLGVCGYIGGVGGKEYLRKAQYVARSLGIEFPPVAIWRPRDVYLGLAQLEAMMTYRRLTGTFDLSQHPTAVAQLTEKISASRKQVEDLQSLGKTIPANDEMNEKERNQQVNWISARKRKTIRETGLPLMIRKLNLLKNVAIIKDQYPCIVDYAVNIGLRSTSEQWITHLKKGGDFSSSVRLETGLDKAIQAAMPELHKKWEN